MDRSRVEAIVARHLPALVARLGLERWGLTLAYFAEAPGDDGSTLRGDCTRLVDYERATIRLNHEALHCEADVLEVLRHELLHCVLAPFDLYSAAVERLKVDAPASELLDRVREHATERAVANLERLQCGPRRPGKKSC